MHHPKAGTPLVNIKWFVIKKLHFSVLIFQYDKIDLIVQSRKKALHLLPSINVEQRKTLVHATVYQGE